MNRLRFEGIEELKAALRQLPAQLRDEAQEIVFDSANEAADRIRQEYLAHKFTGNLAEHVDVHAVASGEFGAGAMVSSRAYHARIFERGTVVRHTKKGWPRGQMPPHPVFGRSMSRARKRMWAGLRQLLITTGFQVSGDGS